MNRRQRSLARVVLGWLCLVPAACGPFSGAPPVSGSLAEATVRGTVRVRGKPVDNGTVTFKRANVRRPTVPPVEAKIGKDGTYTVTTLLGQNYAEVSCKELHNAQNRRYIDNETTLHVEAGENTIDLDLPPRPPSAP